MWTDRFPSSVRRLPRSQVGWGNHGDAVHRRPVVPSITPCVPRLSTGRPHVVPRAITAHDPCCWARTLTRLVSSWTWL
jgi:hypothetical protein